MTQQEMNENGQNTELNINTDENISGDQHLNDPMTEESELERLRTKAEELNDRFLRQAAEFENFKRRNARERMELIQTAGKDVITDLLEVLDDCERAQQQMESSEDLEQIKQGIMLVFNKLRAKLQSKGLKPIEAVDKEFNVDLHEAVTEIEADSSMKGKVVAEVQKGYYLNEKIIRFSKVVVGK